MDVRISKIDPRAVIPAYATPGAGAFDIWTIDETVVSARGDTRLRTGLVFCIPEDHVLFVFTRSSTFRKFGVVLANGVGIIDSDYCGPEDELYISVLNPGAADVRIPAGARLAQGVILPRPKVTFVEAVAAGPNRGGFGSTG